MWTLELFEKTGLWNFFDGETPFTKEEVLEYARSRRTPRAALDLLEELDEDEIYEDIRDIWPDFPSYDDNTYGMFADE